MSVKELLVENWQLIVGAAGISVVLAWDKIKAGFGKIKLPSFKSKAVSVNYEQEDIKALAHLRARAVAVKDEELLKEIKSVAAKFFDIHSNDNAANNA